jgi:hypothetical protein
MRKAPRTLTWTVASTLTLAVSVLPVTAQTNAEDEGTFEILINGRPVGTEDFSIRQTGVGSAATFIASGRVQVLLPTGSLDLTRACDLSVSRPIRLPMNWRSRATHRVESSDRSARADSAPESSHPPVSSSESMWRATAQR